MVRAAAVVGCVRDPTYQY